MLILPAEYPNPIVFDPEEGEIYYDDYSLADPHYMFLQARAVIRDGDTFKGMRTDCVPHNWRKPEDADYPKADPRTRAPDEDRPVTIWHHFENEGDGRIQFSTKFAWNALDLRVHNLVPKQDKSGKTISYSKGDRAGEPVMQRVPFEVGGEFDGEPTVLGKKGYLEVGRNHCQDLYALEAQVVDYCSACQEGMIHRKAFTCRDCGDTMLDLKSANLSEDDEESIWRKGMKCPSCSAYDVPDEEIGCGTCDTPIRTSISDVVWFLRRTGSQTNSAVSSFKKGQPQSWVWLSDFDMSEGDGEFVLEDYDVEEKDGVFTKVSTYHKELRDMLEPFDFNQVAGIGVTRMKNAWIADFLGRPLPEDYDDGDRPSNGSGQASSGRSPSRRPGRR